MAYWLAKKREGQETDFIQRFDPRFWTVDFPRPMMASVVSTAPDALRVECEFHHHDALAGLIWESEDRLDHPLLSYDTNRDYAGATLQFRWRSNGVMPLDAINGPTLTIEGQDAGGATRMWYVRLWNFAIGTPDNAQITLPFSELKEGWAADGAPVHPSRIDRMFISLVPPQYDPADPGLLPARVDGWVELSGISCSGAGAMLVIGDAMLPAHGIGMSTAYDDSYNQTPARILRNVLHLGYRGSFVHYVGMSHFFRLADDGSGTLLVDTGVPLCGPCIAWHEALFADCASFGLIPIISLSFELFDEHCPDGWKQRTFLLEPAQTGWVPPSTLLSPANAEANSWLQKVARAFCGLAIAQRLPLRFQIGEPWFWVVPETLAPCLYDSATRSAIVARNGSAPRIDRMDEPIGPQKKGMLDAAGAILAEATQALGDSVRALGAPDTQIMLLAFTPTILDPQMPELYRANLPSGWASPAFDVLQVEDYDWLTAGKEALRRAAYARVDQRLKYPAGAQHYLAGFVLDAGDADTFWARIDAGLDEAAERGVARSFVWALPQVLRDGYVRLPEQETDVQSFDDVLYPLALGRDASVAPEFSTTIALTASGHERRNSQWSDARLNYDVGTGIRSQAELGVLLEFFRARRGPARGFRLADPYDFSSNGLTGTPTMSDQLIGTGDGYAATFQLAKSYGSGEEPQIRPITRPRAGTILVSVDGVAEADWVLGTGGRIIFGSAPPEGAEIRAGFLFDVPVRFAEDRLEISGATFAAGDAPSVPLIEVREAV